MLDPPLEEDLIFSQSARPFIKSCRLRDLTGSVEVDVVDTAVPSLFGCASELELKEHVRAQSLTTVRQRTNVCGVLREEGGGGAHARNNAHAKFGSAPSYTHASPVILAARLRLEKKNTSLPSSPHQL